MQGVLKKILIALCVIVGFGAIARCAREGDAPSDSLSSSVGEQETNIELSDDELLF